MPTNGQVGASVLQGMLVLDGDGVASAMGEVEPMCGRKGIAIRTVTTELCRVSLPEQSTTGTSREREVDRLMRPLLHRIRQCLMFEITGVGDVHSLELYVLPTEFDCRR